MTDLTMICPICRIGTIKINLDFVRNSNAEVPFTEECNYEECSTRYSIVWCKRDQQFVIAGGVESELGQDAEQVAGQPETARSSSL